MRSLNCAICEPTRHNQVGKAGKRKKKKEKKISIPTQDTLCRGHKVVRLHSTYQYE